MNTLSNTLKEKSKIIKTSVLIIAIVLSVTLTLFFNLPQKINQSNNKYIDDKKTTVVTLTGAALATSVGISLLPGDVGTHVAEQLADCTKFLLVVSAALMLEKYFLIIGGYFLFLVFIPLGCLGYLISLYTDNLKWKFISKKITIVAILFYSVIPVSIKISQLIDYTYETSITTTIDESKKFNDAANKGQEEQKNKEIKNEKQEENKKTSFFDKVKNGFSDAINSTTKIVNNTIGYVGHTIENAQKLAVNYIEGFAVMLVTTCVIPFGVLFVFKWLIKMFFQKTVVIPYEEKVIGLKNKIIVDDKNTINDTQSIDTK